MFNFARPNLKCKLRRFSTSYNRRHNDDEGHWFYSSEWWTSGSSNSRTVFREASLNGNGVVSVLSHPSTRPERCHWAKTEDWLEQRYKEIYPGLKRGGKFRVSDYQWRTLHFNDITRQSTAKVMAAYSEDRPDSVRVMQQPHCLAVPYVKSMVSAGLTSLASGDCDFLKDAVHGKRNMNILCIGHGGGSIPLFLASKIRGAVVHIAEIDPVVISASTQAMGFPSFSIMTPSGKRASPEPDPLEELFWKGTHERLLLFNSDAEKFILENNNIYDLIFIDAYDGDDIFPRKLWDPNSPFLQALASRLNPHHGTVVLNLHSDADLDFDTSDKSGLSHLLLKGKNITRVCRSYKEALLQDGNGLAFGVSVPWLCNVTFVLCRGFRVPDCSGRNAVVDTLFDKALEVDKFVDMPFSCLQYIKRDFTLVD